MIQYSLMLEYVRFVPVQDASNNLEKLAHLVPVLDYHGESYHSSKGFAISQLQKTSETLRFNFKNDVIGKLLQASDTQLLAGFKSGERGSVTHEFAQFQYVPQCRKTLI